MPSSLVIKLLERVAVLEEKVHSLIGYQKWQLGLLSAILAAIAIQKLGR